MLQPIFKAGLSAVFFAAVSGNCTVPAADPGSARQPDSRPPTAPAQAGMPAPAAGMPMPNAGTRSPSLSGGASGAPVHAGSAAPPAQDASTPTLADASVPSTPSDASVVPDAAPAADGGTAAGCQGALCEGFEGATLDALHWEVVTPSCPAGTGKISLDSSQAHSGKQAVRVDGAAGFCNHVFARPLNTQFTGSDPLYARFYVRMSNAFGQGHVTWLAMHDEHEMKDLRMGGQSEILMWNRESDDATMPELSPKGISLSVKPAVNTWSCVEFLVDGKAGKLSTWVDGKAVEGLTLEGEPTPDVDAQWQRKADWHPQLSDIRFGWESYGGDANTLWFDDVVLGTSRTGC
jgi:hypothetical protein